MKKKGQMHATESFANLVSQSNRKALEPVVESLVQQYTAVAQQRISRELLDSLAAVQTRLMVLEKLVIQHFGETTESLAKRVLDVEDEATGFVQSSEPAKKGDFLRVSIQARGPNEEKWSSPTKVMIHRLATPPTPDIPYQTYKEVEDALIGKVVGNVCDVTVHGKKKDEKHHLRVTVDRISTRKQEDEK